MDIETLDSIALIRAREISNLLFNAVNDIRSDEEKLVIICRFYMYLSPEETGVRLGIAEEYAKQLESRAIASLAMSIQKNISIDDLGPSHYCMPNMDKVTDLYRRLIFRVIPGGKKD